MIFAMKRAVFLSAIVVAACSGDVPGPRPLATGPLPERAKVGGTRFHRLDPADTGLDFRNELRQENTVAYVYMGAGLTVGDYDADGLPDVYLVSQDGANKLFRQVDRLRFEDVTAAAGGLDGGDAWGTAATFADVDGDGDLDLYVCNLESPNLLYVNQGDGSFVEKAGAFGLGATAASTGAAFADYDNDGDLDLYLLTNRVFRPTLHEAIVADVKLPESVRKSREQLLAKDLLFEHGGRRFMAGQQDRLFRNDGYAEFVDVTADSGLRDHGNGLSVVWWDFDDDGHQDLYVANDFQSPDQLYHNNGDGTFTDVTRERLPHTAFFGMGCDFGDIDNDGRMDLCVADMSSTTHYMGKMLMGHMDRHRWFLMNADPPQYMRNALYVNTGGERFLEAAHMAGLGSTDWTWAVRFADLDEDGRVDFYATNGIPVFADNPDIGDRVRQLWQQREYDEALDVLRNMPRVDERNIARRNLGGMKFEDCGAQWGLDESGVTHGAVIVDLDRDGDLDIVTNNLNANASVFENRTSGTSRLMVSLQGEGGNRRGVGARVELRVGGRRQVRQVSLTRGYMSAGDAMVHFGLADAEVIDELSVVWPSGRRQVLRDVAADQLLVVREQDAEPAAGAAPATARVDPPMQLVAMVGAEHRERDFDDFAVQPLLPHRLSRFGPGLAFASLGGRIGDVLWIGGAAGQSGRLWQVGGMLGAGLSWQEVSGPWQAHSECEDMGAVWFDVDSDGDLDLYVASGGVESETGAEALRDRIYVNDGDGAFRTAADGVVPDVRISSSCVAAADYDRDGDVDLFVGARVVPGEYPFAPTSVLLRNDDGRLVDTGAQVAPKLPDLGMVSAACWTDVDDDGFVDLVVAAHWQPLRVLGNREGERLEDRSEALGLAGTRGMWNGVTAADVDGDGDTDLVATNLGLNTKYHASADKPMELFARDFDKDGTLDVVEAKRSGDRTLPVRGLSCSSQAMPFVREKFATFDSFAKATLGDIYGDDLSRCTTLSCTELRHVVWQNQGETFAMRPLPRDTQVSTSFGVQVSGDELLLGHNFFGPEPETGRFDGGLGAAVRVSTADDGGLAFASRSLHVPGDARGVVLARFRMHSVFVVARNDQAPMLLRAPTTGERLQAVLVGPHGNPTGIGARVTLEREGAADVVREVLAGDGYLTQSSSTLRFPQVEKGAFVVRWPDGGQTRRELNRSMHRVTLRR